MALKAVIDKAGFDALDGAIKSEYRPMPGHDGMYMLDAEAVTVGKSVYSLEDVAGLKNALASERQRAEAFESKQREFADLDPKKAREALTKIKEMASWTPEQKVKEQIEAIQKQLEDKYGAERKGWESERDELTNGLNDALIRATAAAILGREDVKGDAELLMPHIMSRTRVKRVEQNGKASRVAEVFDPSTGNPVLTRKQGSADPMGVEELIISMKKGEFGNSLARAFDGSGASGSGARTGGSSGSVRRLTRDEMKDPGTYARAKEAAEKAGVSVFDILPQ